MLSDATLWAIEAVLRPLPPGVWLRNIVGLWPLFESLHFIGLSMLLGTVGMFDLRLLGFARGISFAALHRYIPIGIAGFVLNALTGFGFLCAFPDQYLFNKAFYWKIGFMLAAGVNVLFFYSRVFRPLRALPPGATPPFGARVVGGVSLCAWVGVMTAGRLLTFFRPSFI